MPAEPAAEPAALAVVNPGQNVSVECAPPSRRRIRSWRIQGAATIVCVEPNHVSLTQAFLEPAQAKRAPAATSDA